MSPTNDFDFRWGFCGAQRQEDRLKHKRSRAGGRYLEAIGAGVDRRWPEFNFPRSQTRAFDLRPPHGSCGIHRGLVLGAQPRLRSASANIHDSEMPVRHERERQRTAQYLPPTFTFGSIDLDHRCFPSLHNQPNFRMF